MKVVSSLCILAVLIIGVLSCGHKGDKSDPLYKEVMAIHDEVMPKLSTIHKLKKALRKEEEDASPTILQLITDLEKADEGMMKWMEQFSPPADGQDRKTYLTNQLQSVTVMAADINNAISSAELYLKEKN